MTNQEITVVYKWTANEGQGAALQGIYREVTQAMKDNEPDALQVACYFDESKNTLVVYDLFKNSDALALHLSTTAAGHFGQLLQVATPGEFLFCGDVPQHLQEAAVGMGLQATFAPRVFGFERSLVQG